MMLGIFVLNLLLALSSFTVVVVAFVPPSSFQVKQRSPAQLNAGAPQYDKIDAILQESEKIAEGTYMLHVQVAPSTNQELDYKPGNVLALELKDNSGDLNDDAKKNGGWMRGPYTVSRYTSNYDDDDEEGQSFFLDVMIRVVGKKSKAFVESKPGTPVRFGGKFKVPILDGIDKEEVKKVVLLSTGVGVGPCVGAIELAMMQQDESFPPIALFPSYREWNEVAYKEHLDEIAQKNPGRFEWNPIITSEKSGRVSGSKKNMDMVTASIEGLGITDTHYHLIGNGQMVSEWKAGLDKAGVPEERVTVEMYFNHKAETDKKAIENIASAVMSAATCAIQAA